MQFLLMSWDIYWGLAFGFILSSLIRAFVPTRTVTDKLEKTSVKSVSLAALFGAVSSSCSYAAASMQRTLLLKGASWPNSISFLIASTNLVFEIFIVLVSLLGWSFALGEGVGGVFFIITAVLLLPLIFGRNRDAILPEKQTEKGHQHSKSMNAGSLTIKEKMLAASGYFYMDVMMVGKDILLGVFLASLISVLVPVSFWHSLFIHSGNGLPPFWVLLYNAALGVFIAIISFVCSIGNIVLAAVLWKGGISFGAVIAFILADLVTAPMLMVYRKYYGKRSTWLMFILLTICILLTSLFLDYTFALFHLLPESPKSSGADMEMAFEWDYKAWLNLFFIPISLIYFFTGKKQSAM